MFQPWRMKLREAEAAYEADRLDEARDLLYQEDLMEYLPAKKLMSKIADGLAQRGQRCAELGQTMAGWRDFEAAVDLGADVETVGVLREVLVDRALAEAESYLAAGNPAAARGRLEALQRRCRATAGVRQLEQIAGKVEQAEQLARQGRFAQADAALASAAELRPDFDWLHTRRDELHRKEMKVRALRADLHDALAGERFSEVVNLAERLLEMVPGDEVAADARSRAWAMAGMRLEPSSRGEPRGKEVAMHKHNGSARPARAQTRSQPRFLMWVDGVGGFLVCQDDEVVLGQPVPESRVDVPILGDVSRQHATIRRSGEGYLITPRRETRVNGQDVHEAASLTDGTEIELGEGVRLRFRQPHPLSRTARLEFVSHHRTEPPVDAVLLLAESCILGPAATSHVQCHEWTADVVLFRQHDALYCRSQAPFEIDGSPCDGQGPINRNAQIACEEFSIKLEEV